MLGVAIFAVGVLALGGAVKNCMDAEAARLEDQRARQALQNEIALIESGAVQVTTTRRVELDGIYSGMTITDTRAPLQAQDSKNQPLTNLYTMTIEVDWTRGTTPQSKAISFYVLRTR